MENILVSIIIPIYNSEMYLRRTLNSIINQTYKNLEIILINDGSTDKTIEICEEYRKNDNRVLLFNNSNHGPSFSRNFGIKKANGEYSVFVDADDYIDIDFVEKMLKSAENGKNDLVLCNMVLEYYHNDKKIGQKNLMNIDSSKLSHNYFEDLRYIYELTEGPVVKLLKTDILKTNNIFFPENLSFSEDRLLMIQYSNYVSKYDYINYPLYHYCFRQEFSLSKSRTAKSFDDAVYMLEKEIIYLSKADEFTRNYIITNNIVLYSKMFLKCSDSSNSLSDYFARVNRLMNMAKKYGIDIVGSNKIYTYLLKKEMYGSLYLCFLLRSYFKIFVMSLKRIKSFS